MEFRKVTLGEQVMQGIISDLGYSSLDAYDLLAARAFLGIGQSQILTDDSDFGTLDGVTVFTANPSLLADAAAQGKLDTRNTNFPLQKLRDGGGKLWEVTEVKRKAGSALPGGEVSTINLEYRLRAVGSGETRTVTNSEIGQGKPFEAVDD